MATPRDRVVRGSWSSKRGFDRKTLAEVRRVQDNLEPVAAGKRGMLVAKCRTAGRVRGMSGGRGAFVMVRRFGCMFTEISGVCRSCRSSWRFKREIAQ
jgi:hypothetical protein